MQTGDDFAKGGLTAAGFANQGHDLTGINIQIHILEYMDFPIRQQTSLLFKNHVDAF